MHGDRMGQNFRVEFRTCIFFPILFHVSRLFFYNSSYGTNANEKSYSFVYFVEIKMSNFEYQCSALSQ